MAKYQSGWECRPVKMYWQLVIFPPAVNYTVSANYMYFTVDFTNNKNIPVCLGICISFKPLLPTMFVKMVFNKCLLNSCDTNILLCYIRIGLSPKFIIHELHTLQNLSFET